MDENNKRLVKNTVIMYVQVIVSLIISLLAARLILKALGSSDYGTYNVVGGFVSMMVILSNPMMTGAQRFFAFDLGKKDKEQLAKDFNTTNIIYWILALLIIFFLETIGLWFVNHKMEFEMGRMHVVNWVYQFSIFAFFFNVIAIPYNALLLAHENIFISSLFEFLQKLLQFVAVLLLWIIPLDSLITYSGMMFLISASMRIAPQIYCKIKYEETKFKMGFDKSYFTSILIYSGYNSIGVIALVAMNQGLNVLLNMFFGPIVNAAKGVCSSATGIIHTLTTNIYTPARPQLTKYYAADDQARMWSLVSVVTKFMFYISMIITLPLCVEIDYILRLWLGDYPPYTSLFIQLTLFANIISINGTMLCGVLQAANRIRNQQLTAAVLNLLNLPLSYFALKSGLGPVIPFIIMCVMNVMSLIASIKVTAHDMRIKVNFYYIIIIKLFLSLIISSVIPVLVVHYLEESFCRLMIVVLSSFVLCSISFYFIALEVSERGFILQICTRKVKKFISFK